MSQKNNNFKFNTEPLLSELNKVIQNGINKLLCDYIDNYKEVFGSKIVLPNKTLITG